MSILSQTLLNVNSLHGSILISLVKIILTITLVTLNKWIFIYLEISYHINKIICIFLRSTYIDFGFPVLTLACIQLISAFIGLCLAVKFNFLIPRKVEIKTVAIPILLFTSLITFTSYSIDYNILFVSQMCKFFQISFLFLINGVLTKNFSNNFTKISVVSDISFASFFLALK